MVGKVQKFFELKGYGFLLQDWRTQVFFHVSEWKSGIKPRSGMVVTYDLASANKKGKPDLAVNIKPFETGLNEQETEEFVLALNDGGAQ